MRAFQGRQPFSLSPVLATILEQLQVTQPDADAVAELSRLFTTGRESLPIGYLDDPRLAAAYLGYFFPVNLAKIQVLLDELPEQWEQCPDDRPLRVLDLGTGPGTGVMAVLDWLNQYDPLSLRKLTIAAVDASGEALRQGRQLWNAYSSAVDMSGAELLLYAGDLARPKGGWHNEVVRR